MTTQTIPTQSTALPAEGLVRLPTVLAVLGISRSTWWRGVAAGRYPRGRKISPGCTAYDVRDLRRLIDEGTP
jgi:predicted DNA-binding transcriptional regulator AlpA